MSRTTLIVMSLLGAGTLAALFVLKPPHPAIVVDRLMPGEPAPALPSVIEVR